MKQLKLKEGDLCAVATCRSMFTPEPCSLQPTACSPAAYSLSLARCRFPKATFARFQPHSSSFLDITDHG